MDKYEIKNGLLGMLRDVNIKLTKWLNENKKRQLYGISSEYFLWKNHFLYRNLNRFPVYLVKVVNIKDNVPDINVDYRNEKIIGIKLDMRLGMTECIINAFNNNDILKIQINKTYDIIKCFINNNQINQCSLRTLFNKNYFYVVEIYLQENNQIQIQSFPHSYSK
jgi:hypothetical protein